MHPPRRNWRSTQTPTLRRTTANNSCGIHAGGASSAQAVLFPLSSPARQESKGSQAAPFVFVFPVGEVPRLILVFVLVLAANEFRLATLSLGLSLSVGCLILSRRALLVGRRHENRLRRVVVGHAG